jgi:hypothetical protein
MADDNRYYRSDDPDARAASDRPVSAASDPLAELARLIGQTDPFADLRRQAARAGQPDHRPAIYEHDDGQDTEPQPPGHRSQPQEREFSSRDSYRGGSSYYPEPSRMGYAQSVSETQHAEERHTEVQGEDLRDRIRYGDSRYAQSRHDDGAYAEARYDEPHQETADRSRYYDTDSERVQPSQRYADESPLQEHYQSPGVQPEAEAAQLGDDQRSGQFSSDERVYQDDTFYDGQQSYSQSGDDFYAAEPAPRRSGMWMTTAALCALAVVGSASAFGYRAIFGKTGSSAPPPVITANAAPIKVVPPTPASDPQAGKINYDRFGDQGQGEKVVPREEQPVDVNAVKPEPPRVVLPNPVTTPSSIQGSPATTAAIPAIAPAAPALASGPNEPKKVRTVTIKPDQPSGLDSLSARSAAVQTPSSRVAGAPPSQGAQSNTAPAASMRVASAPPNVKPVKPEPSIAGGFMVQVSSQKSEADAKTSYKTLQAKFPTQLQNRSAVIRRAEVSGKGTFYRAQVGPFTSSDQANEFCKNLQSAGGQCVVQRN